MGSNRVSARVTLAAGLILSLSIVTFLPSVPAPGQAPGGVDVWENVIDNGFGDPDNASVVWLHTFNGRMYAGTEREPQSGPAEIWSTTNGDTWSQVTSFSPSFGMPPPPVIFGMVDNASPAQLYVGYAGPPTTSVSPLYRSTNGTSFTQVNGTGTGYVSTGNSAVLPSPVIFGGSLYFATRNPNGTQIWRRPVDDSGMWTKVMDFASVAVSPVQQMTTWMWVFEGKIYAATTGGAGTATPPTSPPGGAHLWTSSTGAAGSWTDVLASNPGFGDTDNIAIASMADMDGFLYASTTNRSTGGELWRSDNGTTWTQLVGTGVAASEPGGFGDVNNIELHNIRVLDGQLWITTWTEAPSATEVWRTADGTTFFQSNDPGFGDLAVHGFPNMVEFNGAIYWGGGHDTQGAHVYRMVSQGGEPPLPDPTPTPTPSPTEPVDSTTTVGGKLVGSKIKVKGAVMPADPGAAVKVTLYRKKGDRFVKVEAKEATLSPDGFFATSFSAPSASKCKVKAKYPGNDSVAPSSASKTFAC